MAQHHETLRSIRGYSRKYDEMEDDGGEVRKGLPRFRERKKEIDARAMTIPTLPFAFSASEETHIHANTDENRGAAFQLMPCRD
jgi:hypothetical protein